MSSNSSNRHEIVERNVGLLAILIVFAISLDALVEITPLIFQKQTTEPVENLRPYTALHEGDIYIREGCNVCHSQMVRPFRSETERTVTTLLRVKVYGNIHSFGVQSVQGLI